MRHKDGNVPPSLRPIFIKPRTWCAVSPSLLSHSRADFLMKAAKQQSICILGAGPAGLITAHTFLQDGFEDLTVLTRDKTPGGVWAAERVYPGLTLNKCVHYYVADYLPCTDVVSPELSVHGEFRFSQLPMPPPSDAKATGGRLRGEDLRDYFASFANLFLKGKIQYNTEVLRVQKTVTFGESFWRVTVKSQVDEETRELVFDKFVLCTGVSSLALLCSAVYMSLTRPTPRDAANPMFLGLWTPPPLEQSDLPVP